MQTLSKGANTTLPAGPVAVTVAAAAPVDISALLVTASGTVRSDDDFVFYNQPQATGVRYRPDGVDVDPAAVEPEIERVVVTASLDGRGPATFGQLGGLRLDVAVGGAPFVAFVPDGLGPETALLCVEIYRRDAQWKVRAVGQGYADGLAGIATDYGITVDEEPQAPAQPAAPPPAPGKINLDKGRVSLQKRETVSLVKTGAPALRRVAMGLGWDPARGGRDIDLDASAITIDRRGRRSDSVWFMSKSAYDGAIAHSGDNLTGAGEGDDETIEVDLARLPDDVVAVVFTVNSFRGQKFTEVARAYCRLVDLDGRAELVRFDLTDSEPRTGVIMSVLHRAGATWEMTAIGEFHDGKTVRAMYGPAEETVAGLLR
ncbi:Stress response protein SCP2 [Pseudonocardia thermophila]|uniref:Stress response protein SCP2 n=1 Tax=Pseudonocardia thermophila TaxID=1848 RepID=A0A1M6Y8R8_PSETH|nr:Stress response protein SCP2 [Pseudonocardia thermophila]